MRKIEIVTEFKHIQVRDTVDSKHSRFVVGPLDTAPDAETQALKNVLHTQEIKDAYLAHISQ